MDPTGRGALTSWRRHREGQVRTWKESDRASGTYVLETASGRTRQDTERIKLSEGHSLSGDGIGRDKSEHGMKELDRARGTHQLETAPKGTSQNTERKVDEITV